MLRVRIDGGQLTTEQLRVIAGISTEFGRDTADLTDRQNIQLHWIRVEDVPEIWRRLEAVGLGTTEACGDVPRVVLGSPVAGIAADELIDPTAADRRDHVALHRRRVAREPAPQVQDRDHRATPARTSCTRSTTSPSSPSSTPSSASATTCGSAAACRRPRGSASAWARSCAPEQVADAWHGVAQIFRDYGYRRLRNKARLKFLLAEWGTEKFRQVLQDEYLGYALPDGPAAPKPLTPGDHVGVHQQKDGRFYVGVTPIVGRVSGPTLAKLADAHRGARLDPPAHDAAPEARDPRHPRRPRRVAHRRARRARAVGAAEPDPPRHDRVHGHRVLQARDRRDEGLRDGGRARPRGASRRLRAAASDLACTSTDAPTRARASRRPTSGSRASSSRSTASRCPGYQVHLGGGLASQDRDEAGPRPHRARPEGAPPTASPTTSSASSALPRRPRCRTDETFAQWAHRADEEALE